MVKIAVRLEDGKVKEVLCSEKEVDLAIVDFDELKIDDEFSNGSLNELKKEFEHLRNEMYPVL